MVSGVMYCVSSTSSVAPSSCWKMERSEPLTIRVAGGPSPSGPLLCIEAALAAAFSASPASRSAPQSSWDAGDEDGEDRAKLQKTAHDWCPPDEGEWLAKAIPSEWLAIKPFNEGGQSLSVAFANAETAAAPTTDSAVAFFLRASGILRR